MRRFIIAMILAAAITGIASAGVMLGQGSPPNPVNDAPDSPMVVLYTMPDKIYLQSILYNPDMTIREHDGKLYIDGHVVLNTLVNAGWGFYKYKPIPPIYDDDDGLLIEIPQYIDDLGLEPLTPADLPHSQHIGKITAINPANAKPVTIVRRWQGANYTIKCLASQSIYQLYAAGVVDIGDYVIVSFIEEHPNAAEYNIPIVVDKVYESW